MAAEIWLSYLATVLIVMIVPGPSHLLMLSNSLTHGFRPSLATAAGDLTANLLQMLAAGLGLAALVVASERAFAVIKWAGVAYLVWLGLRMITGAHMAAAESKVAQPDHGRLWWQGFVTSAANPKAIAFFAALFPQFIRPGEPFWPQLVVLSLTYLTIDGLFLSAYGAGAGWLGARLRGPTGVWLHRAGGLALILAALVLSTKTLRS